MSALLAFAGYDAVAQQRRGMGEYVPPMALVGAALALALILAATIAHSDPPERTIAGKAPKRRRPRMRRNGPKRYLFTSEDGTTLEDAPKRGTIEDAIDWAIELGSSIYLRGPNNEDCGFVSPEGRYSGKETYKGDPRVVGYLFTHDPDGAAPEDAPERGTIEDAIAWAIESGGWVYLWGYNNADCGVVSPEGEYIGGEEYEGDNRLIDT